jgi:hypothetical protein
MRKTTKPMQIQALVEELAVARIDVDGVYLNVSKDDVKNSSWDHRPTESVETLGHYEEPQV